MPDNIYTPLVTAILGLGAGAYTLITHRRADFERARQLHESLTTGPIAEARHAVGSAFEDPRRGEKVQLENHEVQAFFAVLWCFERIDVARDTLLGRWSKLPGWINPRRALDRSIRVHVEIYSNYLQRAYVDGKPLVDGLTAPEEDAGLRRLRRRISSAA